MKHFGDSYDIVKQSLLGWLRSFGDWSVHPMFTESVQPENVEKFAAFLNANIISTDVLESDTERSDYFSCAHLCSNLFLDPTTGLSLKPRERAKRANYLYISELVQLTQRRTQSLTIVFDQSLAFAKEEARKEQLQNKLNSLLQHDVLAFAYFSHACFIITGREKLLERARKHLIAESRLPEDRFLHVTGIPKAAHA